MGQDVNVPCGAPAYLRAAVNPRHPSRPTISTGPLVFLESRTATPTGPKATSTQLPSGSTLKLLFRQGERGIGRVLRLVELARQRGEQLP
jgi:hypothetical protein